MIIIPLVEEYGFRFWLWYYPGTETKLLEDWLAGYAPLNCFDPSRSEYHGRMKENKNSKEDDRQWRAVCAATTIRVHVHEEDDTWLQINGRAYPPGRRKREFEKIKKACQN